VKYRKKTPYIKKLLIAMGIYAGVFIALAAFGLIKFWDYIDAYENSRPQNTIDAYMEQLDTEHIKSYAADLIASIDHNMQSEDDCLQAITDSLNNRVTYARKLSECTDDRLVYMLMCGGKNIGKVVMTAQSKDAYGYATWKVTEESFDFSFLLGEGTSVTVPQDYRVYVNGTLLTENYITKDGIPFALLDGLYDDYDLPYMVSYEIKPLLGSPEITITDPNGNAVTAEDALNEALVLNNCTDSESAALDEAVSNYIHSYVRFATNAEEKLQENYQDLLTHIVPGSALADRMKGALNGLKWVKNHQAQILSTTTHHRIHFPDDRYLYDLSYEASDLYNGQTTTTTENVHLILKQTESGLKVERMINY